MQFENSKFFDYTVRYTVIDNVKMYLVSDLIGQYNKINKASSKMHEWLKLKGSMDYIIAYTKEYFPERFGEEDLPHQIDLENLNIPSVIVFCKKISLPDKPKMRFGYIVNEDILLAITMWMDLLFATKLHKFINNIRNAIGDKNIVEVINETEPKKQVEKLTECVQKRHEQSLWGIEYDLKELRDNKWDNVCECYARQKELKEILAGNEEYALYNKLNKDIREARVKREGIKCRLNIADGAVNKAEDALKDFTDAVDITTRIKSVRKQCSLMKYKELDLLDVKLRERDELIKRIKELEYVTHVVDDYDREYDRLDRERGRIMGSWWRM